MARHAVIMAGGSGTRLWPLSRRSRPKQLLRLFDGQSLLALARRRLTDLFAPENIWVITSAQYLDQVAAALPDIPRANLIGEPVGRDTANAIGVAANILALRDADATMAVFTADHLISPQEDFAKAIEIGLSAAERNPDSLITFGIIPDQAHTGYGYVRKGAAEAAQVFRVAEFKEKPDTQTAQRYLAAGEYLWNAGIFAWRVTALLAELRRQLPENAQVLAAIAPAWRAGRCPQGEVEQFAALPKISIDYAVMEHAADVLIVPMMCHWVDVGSWAAMAMNFKPDKNGNIALASRSLVVDGESNIIVNEGDHLIAALGVSDLIVVHSADATLICHRSHEQDIRHLVELVSRSFGEHYI
jgi:mannose-1-phosphate guanylyltransferase